jgi:hypothetical protein
MTGGIKYIKENQVTSSSKEGYFPENSETLKKTMQLTNENVYENKSMFIATLL